MRLDVIQQGSGFVLTIKDLTPRLDIVTANSKISFPIIKVEKMPYQNKCDFTKIAKHSNFYISLNYENGSGEDIFCFL